MDNTALKSFLYAKENISFGMEEYKHGNYQNALRAFDSVIRSDCWDVFYLAFYCRGLTYMKLGRLEDAVEDFSFAIYCKGGAPDPYYWRAIVYAEKNPGHYSLYRGWGDICSAIEFAPDGKHPAHGLLPIWRKMLFDAGFFPYLNTYGFWREFSRKYKVLYHVVPEQHDASFRKGEMAFRSLANLRNNVENRLKDSQEGVSEHKTQIGKYSEIIANEIESFVLCFSKQPEIKSERGGVLYQVNTEKFMGALMKGFDVWKIHSGRGIQYFSTGEHYSKKAVTFVTSAGQVVYGKQMDNVPSPFVKEERFSPEQEVRVAFEIMSAKGVLVGDKSYIYRTLTTVNPIIKIKINPDGCFHRMG